MQEQDKKRSVLVYRSDSQTLVDTQKLVAHYQFLVNLVIFVCEPLASIIKNTDFTSFSCMSQTWVSHACDEKKYFLTIWSKYTTKINYLLL